MTIRVWRVEASHERVVLGPQQARDLREAVPTLVHSNPEPSESSARLHQQMHEQKERIAALEARLRAVEDDNTVRLEQLTDLRAGLQEAHREAQERGLEAGMRDAEARVQRHLEQQTSGWKAATEEMLRQNESSLQALRAELTDVVLAAVAKVLGEQLANPNVVRASTEQLLKECGVGGPIRVLLAPAQHEQLMKSGGAPLAWFRDRRLEIGVDERVRFGGCLLETAQGIVDGRFEVQLEKLRQVLAPHYGARR